MSKRTERLALSLTPGEAEDLEWLAFLNGQSPATYGYQLLRIALAAEMDKPGNNGPGQAQWKALRTEKRQGNA